VDREQLYAAATALRVTPRRRTSLAEIADTYLEGSAREAFLNAVPDPSTVGLLFEVQRDVLERTLQFRVFELATGVVVSSPFGEIGESVLISEGVERELHCSGVIVNDKMRTRHA
jgi:hypothetical protein